MLFHLISMIFGYFICVFSFVSVTYSWKASLFAGGLSRRAVVPIALPSLPKPLAEYSSPVFQTEARSSLIEIAKGIDLSLKQGSRFGEYDLLLMLFFLSRRSSVTCVLCSYKHLLRIVFCSRLVQSIRNSSNSCCKRCIHWR
jgi:hypothetical protein